MLYHSPIPDPVFVEMSIAASKSSGESVASAINVFGARTHNLRNINVAIPRGQLVVVTGRSGSGKSSLAFDTIYAEGQRQYIESLSVYSRQFFSQLPRADVDSIDGLPPTLCLDQHHQSSNRRSTVGTVTEIYQYLRVLMARIGEIHCHGCGRTIEQHTPHQVRDAILNLPERTKIMILAPMVADEAGMHQEVLTRIRRERLVRVRINGELYDIDQLPEMFGRKKYSVEAVTDRIIVREGIDARLLESIDNAVRLSQRGQVACCWLPPAEDGQSPGPWQEYLFSTVYACPDCNISYPEVQPRTFSFNSPFGACQTCEGLGSFIQFDPDLIVDTTLSIDGGAVTVWKNSTKSTLKNQLAALQPILDHLNWSTAQRLDQMSADQWECFLNSREKGRLGLTLLLQKELATTNSEARQVELEQMQNEIVCSDCHGSRVSRQARAIFLAGRSIAEIVQLSIDEAYSFFKELNLDGDAAEIARPLLREINHRLKFLQKVGVGYLTIGRSANTLSGGEHQRVRLATSIGSGVTNVCFVLDEPSIGLHQRDNDRLIEAIGSLRQSGNSLIVVEHDEAMIRTADHVIDMGPGSGQLGGQVVAEGTPAMIADQAGSLTGKYLSGQLRIKSSGVRRPVSPTRMIRVQGAAGHNLKSIDVELPLGVFCCVTGASGSGKSTLINQTIAPAIARQLDLAAPIPQPHDQLTGVNQIDKLIMVDQKPIGRSSRACPATFTGVFDEFRRLFAATRMAKQRGYGIGRFSFNTKSGWCPDCQGHGVRRIAMNFMPDVFVTCETCGGKRFNHQTLQVRFAELSIADVLELTVDRALECFEGFSKIVAILKSLSDVGLGYLLLGQSAQTLSGGEAQRIKLATELARAQTGNTLYILDEPTTGLHFEDIRVLLDALNRLVDLGNSMVVIEHNLDMIRCADWVIDLGPEGGDLGGELIGAGTPEAIAAIKRSHTGRYLAQLM